MKTKKSLNPVPLSMRGKKRYVLFELFSEKRFSENDVHRAVWNILLSVFGSAGTGRQKPQLMKFDSQRNRGILRCSLETVEEVKAGLLFLKEINGAPVIPKILSVSGTMKKIKGKARNKR